ncbi:RsmB/NOP family class I SAM-dependent RNA methyltransferase [Myceligenerans pegani]|uniref:rRNA small subunit methyltransferase B n=1 Tax=Myceligenerans pegani TaxID=2776917 RepID=A0ABR9MUB9_9MICO|nr:transcription antitermination factor NusB [Myceligenerans sp. TRM 65318]MBE1874965.1 rRNA small subunit methyltransferase B [Myceligenerans sp. TRM 65318]MBE3017236.1 rRNA small subunit methyltransferase B [Myceligenerans sp. TRM 65318]
MNGGQHGAGGAGHGRHHHDRHQDRRRPDREDDRRDSRGRQRSAARSRGERSASRQAPGQRAKRTDPARTAAFDVLREVDESDAYANLVLPPLLADRRIRGRDAGFATELTYGTLRMRGRYDAILADCVDRPLDELDPAVLDVLRLGTHQLLGMRVPSHAAVSETVALARGNVGTGPAQFVNAVLRRVSEAGPQEWLERITAGAADELAALAAVESHPLWIARSLREALAGHGRDPGEIGALLAADNAAPRVTLVARPGLADVSDDDAWHDADLVPGRWAPTALVLDGNDPGTVPAVRDGRAGVQDEGSQLVTLALAGVPLGETAGGRPERWLDLCAGPGGKSALLAALAAQREATLVANEIQPHRARLVERALAAIPDGVVEEVRIGDGRDVGTDEPGAYDRVLVDAPCTGLGALRRRPESRWRRTPADLATLTGLQRELLGSALDAVRPGGVVAYVTCSPVLAETQLVVTDVLRRRDDVERLDTPQAVRSVLRTAPDGTTPDLPLPSGDSARDDVQLWPHVHGTDAMHLTLLRRR